MLNNIQISRGLAALFVLLAHANLIIDKSLFSGFLIIGWSGVDFFFVLSGFIIFYTSQKYFFRPSELKKYFYKRLTRIYPVYWVYTLFFFFVSYLVFHYMNKSIFGYTENFNLRSFLGNILLLPTDVPANIMPILPVAWTLTYEVMFYLLFGIAFLIKPMFSFIFAILWIGLIFSKSFGFIFVDDPASLAYILTEERNLEFLLGCLAAWLLNYRNILNRHLGIILILGFLTFCFSWLNAYFDYVWMRKIDSLQFGVPFFCLVLGFALLDKRRESGVGSLKKFFIFLGDASYSIYLTHFGFIVILNYIGQKIQVPSVFIFLFSVILSIFAGCTAYVFIEKKIMNKLKKFGSNLD